MHSFARPTIFGLSLFIAATGFSQTTLSADDYQSIGLISTLSENIGTVSSAIGEYYLGGADAGLFNQGATGLASNAVLYAPARKRRNVNLDWTDNSTESQWLTVSNDGDTRVDSLVDDSHSFTVSLNFDLTGYQDVGFNINMSFDDNIQVKLNDTWLKLTGSNSNRWATFSEAFSLTSESSNYSAINQGGLNTLTFVITNNSTIDTSATGFRVEFDGLVGSPVPEPATSAALLGAGVLGLVTWRRRRRH